MTITKDDALNALQKARKVQHLMKDERSIRALDVAERYIRGEASREELEKAKDEAWAAYYDAHAVAWDARASYDAIDVVAALDAAVDAAVAAARAAYNAVDADVDANLERKPDMENKKCIMDKYNELIEELTVFTHYFGKFSEVMQQDCPDEYKFISKFITNIEKDLTVILNKYTEKE